MTPLPPVVARALPWLPPLLAFRYFARQPGTLFLDSASHAGLGASPAGTRVLRNDPHPVHRDRVGPASQSADFDKSSHDVIPGIVTANPDDPGTLGDGLQARGDSRSRIGAAERVPDARYSYLALEPLNIVSAWSDHVTRDGIATTCADPFAVLAELLATRQRAADPQLPPFQGGLAGMFAYDLLHHLERVDPPRDARRRAPDLHVGLYDLVIAFDHAQTQCWVLCGGLPELVADRAQLRARERISGVVDRWDELVVAGAGARETAGAGIAAAGHADTPASGDPALATTAADAPPVLTDFTRPAYEHAVARIVEHVHAGDLFQANLAQRFRIPRIAADDDIALYERLRAASPAPFGAFLRAGPITLASASPERFLAVRAGRVEARPVKGTRPRSDDPETDAALAAQLLASEKDRAENVMIVDLKRNDLSRVCRDGSVRATQLCRLESFSGVHHLVSTVVGERKSDAGPIDLVRAAFPSGSITGAPRVRAMEVIHALEPVRRGPYCGAIGWIGFNGDMDLSVAIRTAVLDADYVSIHAGGGIVADSIPGAEYDETLVKAASLVAAARGCAPPPGEEAVAAMSRWMAQQARATMPGVGAGGASQPSAVSAPPSTTQIEAHPRGEARTPDSSPAGGRGATPAPAESGVPMVRTRSWQPADRSTARNQDFVLLIDNYDSFVDNLARYIGELGWSREVVRNDALTVDEIAALDPAHIVLSPGPGRPEDAGVSIELVRRLAHRIPMVGICLGHQAMATALGGTVVRAHEPMHGRTSKVQHDGLGAFEGVSQPLTVTRYHSLIVQAETLPAQLQVSARLPDGTIMAFRHRVYPMVGLQFHPEAVLTEDGHRILSNILGRPGAQRTAGAGLPRALRYPRLRT